MRKLKRNSILVKLLIPVALIIFFQLLFTETFFYLIPMENELYGRLISIVITVLTGAVILAVISRYISAPLNNIAAQLKQNSGGFVDMQGTGIEQIDILVQTINEMRKKQNETEALLVEDKKRYLLALESAADAFVEYDALADTFSVYYFTVTKNGDSKVKTRKIQNFSEAIDAVEICHMDDIPAFLAFLRADDKSPIEIRVAVRYFPHLKGAPTDGAYYWFSIRGSFIYDNGKLKRIIGTGRHITHLKLRETELVEQGLRDVTTGFYNRDHGIMLIKNEVAGLTDKSVPFAIVCARINGYRVFEAHYGRYFAGVVMRIFCKKVLDIIDDNIAARLNNYEFLFLFTGEDAKAAEQRVLRIQNELNEMYKGENTDLDLTLSAGIASGSGSYKSLFAGAYTAAVYASKARAGIVRAGGVLTKHMAGDYVFKVEPITIEAEVTKNNIAAFAFDLFEHTTDIESVVKILLITISEMFSLSQMIVCSYDTDLSVSRVAYQWAAPGHSEHCVKIEKVSQEDVDSLEQMLDDNGALIYNLHFNEYFTPGMKSLLCITEDENFSAICCAMYESGVHAGRIICKAADADRLWSGDEMSCLNEVTKIISAHISVQKSNSASRAKSEFLSRMSHEIRTPMNAIIGMTGIAKESVGSPEKLADCLNKIDFSAKHLLALINDVLEMSRIESGKLVIKDEPFLLSNLVRDLDTLMRPPIEEKGITLNIETNVQNNSVTGDEYRIKQVLVNFLGNAQKFTNSGGNITLSVTELNNNDNYGKYLFAVKDTGIGISKQDKESVFKAFEQAEGEHRKQGTGLGLAISSNIVTAMGAKIELDSELGAGSVFSFTLKLKTAPKSDAPEHTDDEPIDDVVLTGKRILLVDDNDVNVEIARFVLEGFGIVVEAAYNGKEAVDMFLNNKPYYFDAVLMDIHMPVMDGLTATREIRRFKDRTDASVIPIIAMTADAFDDDMKKSMESGMNGHVAKPVDNNQLFETLKGLLNVKNS